MSVPHGPALFPLPPRPSPADAPPVGLGARERLGHGSEPGALFPHAGSRSHHLAWGRGADVRGQRQVVPPAAARLAFVRLVEQRWGRVQATGSGSQLLPAGQRLRMYSRALAVFKAALKSAPCHPRKQPPGTDSHSSEVLAGGSRTVPTGVRVGTLHPWGPTSSTSPLCHCWEHIRPILDPHLVVNRAQNQAGRLKPKPL